MRNIGRGSGAATVVLVGLDGDAMGLVRETLAAEAVLPNAPVGFGDAIGVVKRARPDVVIVGYSRAIDAALELAEALRREQTPTTLVALADKSDAEAILAAMRVGYKEFVVLPDDAARLRQVVHEAAYAPDDEEDKGLVVAVTGAKGGVGATVLATHLAAELAAIHRVLCIDLDFGMGDVASMLDLSVRDSIAELLPRADRIDERSLTGSVIVHKSKVHVLATPDEMESITEVRGDDVFAVVNAAARAYQFVIVDCGSYYDEGVTVALSVADAVVLVTTPDVTSVRDAFRRIKMLNTIGVEKERIRLVVNRFSANAFVSLEDIKQNLGIGIAATISDDPRIVEQAVNEGRLVRDLNKKSDVARDIANLVAVLTDDPEEIAERNKQEDNQRSGGFFASLFNRG
ncbi:MAG: pilus assembly protein CpaE [Myxococcota bacterium]